MTNERPILHGTEGEAEAFMRSVDANCSCESKGTQTIHGRRQVQVLCPMHQLLADGGSKGQRFLDHLLWHRRTKQRLIDQEQCRDEPAQHEGAD